MHEVKVAKISKLRVIEGLGTVERHKQAKIRKRRNQRKIPTPKTEAGKNQSNNQVLIP